MTDTTPLAGEQLRDIRYHAGRPSQFTAHTIRRDYTNMLGEIDRLRAVEAAAFAFADEMGDRCDEHGGTAHHCDAQRLRDRLQQAGGAA